MLRNPLILNNEGLTVFREWPDSPQFPISLNDMKEYLRVDFDREDGLIQSLIEEVTWAIEEALSVSLVYGTEVNFTLKQWNKDVPLPIQPFTSITNVTIDGTANTDYTTFGASNAKVIQLTSQGCGQLVVNYVSGFENVPPEFKSGIRRMVADLYEYRDSSFSVKTHSSFSPLRKYQNMYYVT